MTPFELLTSVTLGLVSGFVVAAVAHWRDVGSARALAAGALGGLVGALVGFAVVAEESAWGELEFHPALIPCAIVAGAAAVALVHLLRDGRAYRRTRHGHGPAR